MKETKIHSKSEFYIYVIELDKSILKLKAFRKENPDYIEGKPCVYVGYSSKTPEERFRQHINGARNKRGPLFSRKAKKYGLRLKPRLYRSHNPMENKEEAMAMEVKKARRLRKRGYGVWQK
tara:strand:- start:364 stop:726 length:363 start_codon:yes stop_codon:yes gene_type:complete